VPFGNGRARLAISDLSFSRLFRMVARCGLVSSRRVRSWRLDSSRANEATSSRSTSRRSPEISSCSILSRRITSPLAHTPRF
jgi:hypothetical protein